MSFSRNIFEAGPQNLMPTYHLSDGSLENPHVERTAKSAQGRHVVFGSAGLELVQKPQLFLCKRQR